MTYPDNQEFMRGCDYTMHQLRELIHGLDKPDEIAIKVLRFIAKDYVEKEESDGDTSNDPHPS